MRRSSLWILGILFGIMGIFIFSLPLWPSLRDIPVNTIPFCIVGIVGYLAIFIYSCFVCNLPFAEQYEKLNDKDKLLDLLEDQYDLEREAAYCVYRAQKNIEKIEKLFPEKSK